MATLRQRGVSFDESVWSGGPRGRLSSIDEARPGGSGHRSSFPTQTVARRCSSQFWDEVTQYVQQTRPEPLRRRTTAAEKPHAPAQDDDEDDNAAPGRVSQVLGQLGWVWDLPDSIILVYFPLCGFLILGGLVMMLINGGVSDDIADSSLSEAELRNPLLRKQKAQTSERAVVTSLLLAMAVLVFNTVGFVCLRRRLPDVFSPAATPEEKTHTFFQTIRSTVAMDDEDFLRRAGFDAYMVMRLPFFTLRFCFYAFCPWGMVAMAVSYWWQQENATGAGEEAESAQVVGFLDGLSLSALPPGSAVLWIYVPLAYILTAITTKLIYDEQMIFIRLRRRFVRSPRVEDFSVLVVDIPREYRSNAALFGLFDSMYPGQVHCATVVPDTLKLRKMITNANSLRDSMEKRLFRQQEVHDGNGAGGSAAPQSQAMLQMHSKLQECTKEIFVEQALLLRQIGDVDRAVDEIVKRRATECQLTPRTIYSEKREFKRTLKAVSRLLSTKKSCKYGFVSFNNLRSATIARQVLHDSHVLGFTLKVYPAPAPADMHWRNLTRNAKERHNSAAVGYMLEGVLATFWMVPVVAAMSLVSAESLSENVPFLAPLIATPLGAAIVEGAVPALLLSIVMLVLPQLLIAMAMYESSRSHSEVEMVVVLKYFGFLFLNIFVVTTFGGTVFDGIETITNNPRQIPYMVGVTLPTRSKFFLSYILVDGVVYYTGLLMQWVPLLVKMWRKCCTRNPTPRQMDQWAAEREPPDNIYCVPKMLMYLVLAQTFALLAPMVIPATALVFGVGQIVYKYLLLQVYEQRGSSDKLYDSGGLLWILIAKCLVFGMVCSHLTLMAVLTLKEGWWQMLCLVPLPIATTLLQSHYGMQFERSARYMPLMECINFEHSLAAQKGLEVAYQQHCLNPDRVSDSLKLDPRVNPPDDTSDGRERLLEEARSLSQESKAVAAAHLESETEFDESGALVPCQDRNSHRQIQHQPAHHRCTLCGATCSTAMHGHHFSSYKNSNSVVDSDGVNGKQRGRHQTGHADLQRLVAVPDVPEDQNGELEEKSDQTERDRTDLAHGPADMASDNALVSP